MKFLITFSIIFNIIFSSFHAMSQSETGHSGSDSKLKSLDRNISYLEKSLEEYSNNLLTTTDENGNLIHNGFESALKKTETDIVGVKKFAPNYDLSSRINTINSLEKKYNEIKSNSKQRIEGIQAEKQKKEFETSSEFFIERESFKEKPVDPKSSAFHHSNGAKIVFSSKMISKENPTVNLSNQFKATEHIYGRAFLEDGFLNTTMYSSTGDSARYMSEDVVAPYAILTIEGVQQNHRFENVALFGADAKASTRQIWLHPNVSDGLTEIHWVKTVNNLSPGSHTIKVDYYIEHNLDKIVNGRNVQTTYTAKIAEGSFTIQKNADDKIKIGKSWSSFLPKMSNPGLESKILTVAVKTFESKDGMSPKAIKIMDSDWKIVKHHITGEILFRYLTVQVKCVNSDGYCYTEPREAKQEYSGGGYSSEITLIKQYNKNIGFDGYIDCE